MADLTKEQLEALFNEFNPAWEGVFANELADNASWRARLGRKMYNTDSGQARALKDAIEMVAGGVSEKDAAQNVTDFYRKAALDPFSTESINLGKITVKGADGADVVEDLVGNPMGRTAKIGAGIVKAHPWQSLGAAAGTAGSLAGLFDNDKIGGQLIATGLGAAIPAIAGMKLNPLTAYTVATGAGSLGALFDTLRSKKADERAAMQGYGREEYVR